MSSISAGTTSTTTLVHSGDTTGSLVFKTNDTGSGGTTAVTIDTSQNVGIGTSSIADTSSTGKVLEIYGGANGAHIHFTNSATGQGQGDGFIVGTAIGTTDALLVQRESANMIFRTADTERMRIDSSGRLLVNKTSTSSTNGAKVYVAGHFSQPSGTANTDGTTDAKNYGYGWCASASEDAMAGLITSNLQGNWGMDLYVWLRNSGGGTLNNRFQISNAGACYNSTGTYGTISDINVKENIVPAPNYLDRLMQIEIVKYSLKEEHSDVPTKLGVVAQQVEQIFPNIVEETNSSDENGDLIPTKAVKYSVFVPMLVKAIQELKAINDQQAETINALTARVVALEGQ